MMVHVRRVPFSLDPLIAKAKMRARTRRFLLAGLALVLGGTAASAIALRSSERPRPAILAAEPCRLAQLDLVPGRAGVAAGTATRDFAFVNSSEMSCTLRGWPNLRLFLEDGSTVTPRVRRDHYGSGTVLPARTIRLSPGGAASFRIAESDGTGTGLQTCRAVKALLISMPGAGGSVSASTTVFYCAPYTYFEAPLVAGRIDRKPGY
jgi:uncharacterized protein DUF4232